MGKFNKDIAKKVSIQTIGGGDGKSDSQGIKLNHLAKCIGSQSKVKQSMT